MSALSCLLLIVTRADKQTVSLLYVQVTYDRVEDHARICAAREAVM